MAVPTQLSDLSETAASNSPAGTDTVGTTMDDFIRAHASIIARISAGTDALATPALGAATATTVNKITFTQPATGATVTIGNGKTLTVNGNTTLNTGISDTATAVALSLSGSGANSITIANSETNPTIGTTAGNLAISSTVNVTGGITATGGLVCGEGLAVGWGTGATAYIAGSSASNVIGFYTNSVEQARVISVAGATKRLNIYGGNAGNAGINVSSGSLDFGSPVVFSSQTVGTTVGAAGGASALPAAPLGYITTAINGTACKIPYYTA